MPIVRSRLLKCFYTFISLVVLLGVKTVLASEKNLHEQLTEQWGVYEIELDGPSKGNPFTDIRLSAKFDNGEKKINVPGFYDGNGKFRIRFMPDTQGSWHYETKSNDWQLSGRLGKFTVTAPSEKNHGPVQVHNTHHFRYADGRPYKQVGTTIYNWMDTPTEIQEQTLKTLAQSPFNKARMLLTQQPNPYKKKFHPKLWPYEGKAPDKWDFSRFNTEYFQHYEKRIQQLSEIGVEADIILFNPYGKWGFNSMSAQEDELYVRYVVARFGAYRNVWWSLANEYDFLRTKTEDDWNRIGQLIQKIDPHNRLRSIHNGKMMFNHNQPWITHASIQSNAAIQSPGAAYIYRFVFRKPVVYDEVQYEGKSAYRWGDISGRAMLDRFWNGTIAGTYVGHGDYFFTDVEDTWTSFGGKLSGESTPRLAFLKTILDEGPADGLDPIDFDYNPNVAGKAGEYYLIYLGDQKLEQWDFKLYKTGLKDGMQFKVEIIDTWDMTISEVDTTFVTKKQDNYYYVDRDNSSIKLPNKSGLALRIKRLK